MVTRLITDEQEANICRRYAAGESAQKIGNDLGANRQTITNIIKRNDGAMRASGGSPCDRVGERYGRLIIENISERRTKSGSAYCILVV